MKNPNAGSSFFRADDSLTGDTIVALATPPGRGAVANRFASGAGGSDDRYATRACGQWPAASIAARADILDETGRRIDGGLALFFPSPAAIPGKTCSNCTSTVPPLSRAKSCERG